jgi:glycerophosphoryl diester phosphodiesterase
MPRPQLIAHRGLPREVPENTVASFLAAVRHGAEAVELDVHALADGTVVVHHDPVLGRGLPDSAPHRGRPLAELSLADLARVRFAGDVGIPTLAEVLGTLPPKVSVYAEVKAQGIEAAVADTIRPHAARCAVHSFDHRIPRAVAALVPGVPCGILQVSYLVDPVGAIRAAGARDLWQHWEFIDEPLVRTVHAAGGRVVAWTVNDPEVARRLAGWGVDGLCGDDVGGLGAALA